MLTSGGYMKNNSHDKVKNTPEEVIRKETFPEEGNKQENESEKNDIK